jgi:hypothetical protein
MNDDFLALVYDQTFRGDLQQSIHIDFESHNKPQNAASAARDPHQVETRRTMIGFDQRTFSLSYRDTQKLLVVVGNDVILVFHSWETPVAHSRFSFSVILPHS